MPQSDPDICHFNRKDSVREEVPPETACGWLATGAMVGALVAAFFGEYAYVTLHHPTAARSGFATAAILMVVTLLALRSSPTANADDGAPRRLTIGPTHGSRRRTRVAGLVSLLGLAAGSIAAHMATSERSDLFGLGWWLLSLGAFIAAALVLDGRTFPTRPLIHGLSAALELGLVAVILGLAIWLRAINLEGIPPDIHGDETAIGLEARKIIEGGGAPIFDFGWSALPYLSIAPHAFTMLLAGNDIVGLRFASAVQGVLSVALLYILGRRWFGRTTATIAAFLLAVGHWHIHFSRVGLNNMGAELMTLLAMLTLFHALRMRRLPWLLISGYAIGASVTSYFAGRLVPVIVALVVAHRMIAEGGSLRPRFLDLALIAAGCMIWIMPVLAVAVARPEAITSRSDAVFLPTSGHLEYVRSTQGPISMVDLIRLQALRIAEVFNAGEDTSRQYGYSGSLLDFWTAALMPLGLVVALVRLREGTYFALTAWLVLTLVVGGVLTDSAPFSPRLITTAPVLALLAAIALQTVRQVLEAQFGRHARWYWIAGTVVVLAASFVTNYTEYFDRYTLRERPAGFPTALALFAREHQADYRLYVVGTDGTQLTRELTRFLAPATEGVELPPNELSVPLRDLPDGKGAAFVILPNSDDVRPSLRRVYPWAVEHEVRSTGPRRERLFTSYLVDGESLAATRRSAGVE